MHSNSKIQMKNILKVSLRNPNPILSRWKESRWSTNDQRTLVCMLLLGHLMNAGIDMIYRQSFLSHQTIPNCITIYWFRPLVFVKMEKVSSILTNVFIFLSDKGQRLEANGRNWQRPRTFISCLEVWRNTAQKWLFCIWWFRISGTHHGKRLYLSFGLRLDTPWVH